MYIELEKFISACIEKGKCEELGNSKMGNRQYNIIKSSYLALKKLGQGDKGDRGTVLLSPFTNCFSQRAVGES